MSDLFSTGVLNRVITDLPIGQPLLLDLFFPNIQTEDSEEIHFDVAAGMRRLAPFVSPVVAGKVVESHGFSTKTFKPAYIKDKRIFDTGRPLKRAPGEQIGGALPGDERLHLLLANELADQVRMLNRRFERMATEVLLTGACTIGGEQYPTQHIDFGRDPALTVTVTEAARWSQPGANPIEQIEDWRLLVNRKSGAMPTECVMSLDVWAAFSQNHEVQRLLDRARGDSTAAAAGEGANYAGRIGQLDLYVYSGWYVDDNDVEQPMLPPGTVILSGSQLEGVRAFGAIRDEQAGYQAMPYFSKSWLGDDPAIRYLLLQSAPLMVPHRVNASLAATVL